jgi:hypothetical protein
LFDRKISKKAKKKFFFFKEREIKIRRNQKGSKRMKLYQQLKIEITHKENTIN